MTDDPISRALLDIPGTVNASESLRRIGRYCSTDFMLEVGDTPWHFSIKEGEVQSVRQGPFNMLSWHFAIRGSEDAWQKFWSAVPGPGYNDIFAMSAYGHARIEGNTAPLMKDLRYIKEVIALPRESLN